MLSIKYNYRDIIPFESYNSPKYVQSYLLKKANDLYWTPLITYIFNPENVKFVLIKDDQQIHLNKPKRQVITLYLTQQGTLLYLNSGYIQDYVKNNDFQFVNMSIPDDKLFTFNKSPPKPLDPQITYSIHPQLLNLLTTHFKSDSITLSAEHAGSNLTLTLTSNPDIVVQDQYLQLYSKSLITNLKFVKKEEQGLCQSDQLIFKDIQSSVQNQKMFTLNLVKKHLKKVNPSNIYYILPDINNQLITVRNLNLVNINNVPNKLRLLFCMYQAYKIFMPTNKVYHDNSNEISLDLSLVEIWKNLSDIRHISAVLNALAVRYRPNEQINKLFRRLDFDTIIEQLGDDILNNFGFLIYVDDNMKYQYIDRQTPDNWYDSRSQKVQQFTKTKIDEKLKKGVFLRVF